jgi:hypothetical protein
MGVAQRELLGNGSTERHAENIGDRVPERVEEVSGLAGESRHPLRD